jgi:hypothetical protein
MEIYVSEEFRGFTLNCEEKLIGGNWIWVFLVFWAEVHVEVLRRGGTMCYSFVQLGILLEELPGNVFGVT